MLIQYIRPRKLKPKQPPKSIRSETRHISGSTAWKTANVSGNGSPIKMGLKRD